VKRFRSREPSARGRLFLRRRLRYVAASCLTAGAGSFLAHAVGLLIAVALAGFLYRRKIFLRV
jgi:hypothetical protein